MDIADVTSPHAWRGGERCRAGELVIWQDTCWTPCPGASPVTAHSTRGKCGRKSVYRRPAYGKRAGLLPTVTSTCATRSQLLTDHHSRRCARPQPFNRAERWAMAAAVVAAIRGDEWGPTPSAAHRAVADALHALQSVGTIVDPWQLRAEDRRRCWASRRLPMMEVPYTHQEDSTRPSPPVCGLACADT